MELPKCESFVFDIADKSLAVSGAFDDEGTLVVDLGGRRIKGMVHHLGDDGIPSHLKRARDFLATPPGPGGGVQV